MQKAWEIAVLILLLPFVAGCQAWYGFTDRETRQFLSADPIGDAQKEAQKPAPKFLGWNGGSMEPFLIPGLSREEVASYIDSGRFEAQSFHYYHLDVMRKGSKEDCRLRAKRQYAEQFNRELLRLMSNRETKPNQTIPIKAGCPPSLGERSLRSRTRSARRVSALTVRPS